MSQNESGLHELAVNVCYVRYGTVMKFASGEDLSVVFHTYEGLVFTLPP